jgi:hypothetical protein
MRKSLLAIASFVVAATLVGCGPPAREPTGLDTSNPSEVKMAPGAPGAPGMPAGAGATVGSPAGGGAGDTGGGTGAEAPK